MCTLLFHVSFHCVEHLSLTPPPPSLKKRVGLSQKPVKPNSILGCIQSQILHTLTKEVVMYDVMF